MTDPKVYSQLKLKDLEEILQGDDTSVKLQLMKERLDSLHQVGSILLEKYEGLLFDNLSLRSTFLSYFRILDFFNIDLKYIIPSFK